MASNDRLRYGDFVFIRSLNKSGKIVKIEYDETWGPQILVEIPDTYYPKENPVYDHYWVTMDDIEKSRFAPANRGNSSVVRQDRKPNSTRMVG